MGGRGRRWDIQVGKVLVRCFRDTEMRDKLILAGSARPGLCKLYEKGWK